MFYSFAKEPRKPNILLFVCNYRAGRWPQRHKGFCRVYRERAGVCLAWQPHPINCTTLSKLHSNHLAQTETKIHCSDGEEEVKTERRETEGVRRSGQVQILLALREQSALFILLNWCQVSAICYCVICYCLFALMERECVWTLRDIANKSIVFWKWRQYWILRQLFHYPFLESGDSQVPLHEGVSLLQFSLFFCPASCLMGRHS